LRARIEIAFLPDQAGEVVLGNVPVRGRQCDRAADIGVKVVLVDADFFGGGIVEDERVAGSVPSGGGTRVVLSQGRTEQQRGQHRQCQAPFHDGHGFQVSGGLHRI
jgi:hypothetical protein